MVGRRALPGRLSAGLARALARALAGAGVLAGAVAFGAALAAPALAEAPRRVVSMNLCTDQLALLLAAPGQLVSVSYLAQDPASSAMVEAAAAYPVNHGRAEEILGLRPDLVLAGAWTHRSTVDLLRRTGIPVETFVPAESIAGIRDSIRHMGAVLGREAAATALLAEFDAERARLESNRPATPPRAAMYAANGYSSGSDSLSGQIVALGGFANIADEAGIPAGGFLPLERLLLAQPDMLILDRHYGGHSRAEEILDHPALAAMRSRMATVTMSSPDWACDTPRVLHAAAALQAARQALAP